MSSKSWRHQSSQRERMSGSRRNLAIRPLSDRLMGDLARLIRQVSAARWCWCAYYRLRSRPFSGGTVASHRTALRQAIESTISQGRAPGLIAYRDAEPIGWVSVGPRADYARLRHSRALGTFMALLDEHLPKWRSIRIELGQLPLTRDWWPED